MVKYIQYFTSMEIEMIIDKEWELIKEYSDKLQIIKDCLKVEETKGEVVDLENQLSQNDSWQDLSKMTEISKKLKRKKKILENFSELTKDFDYLNELLQLMTESEEDEDLRLELKQSLENFDKVLNENYLNTLLNGKYDDSTAILTLHAGAGGTESQDWASMLLRMFQRYSERKGFNFVIVDMQDGDEAGIKSVTVEVSGENAYGYLKAESGVHRLVRISPFDANSRRHTSFCSCEVVPLIENDNEIVINSDDIRIDTYRSSGAGGQHVNKTDSAVRITHFPTGIVVQCQNQRSQTQNKEFAFNMLRGKLAELKEREEREKINSIKGDIKKIEWGSQIRSYVLCPYTMVKDHRTGFETADVNSVMDGDIDDFICDYLKKSK